MPKNTIRTISFYIAVAVSIALTVVLFIRILELAYRFVKLSSGLPAAAAVFAMVALGIIELSAVIVLSSYFTRCYEHGRFLGRYFLVVSIEVLLFPLVEVLRLFVFLPVTRGSGLPAVSIWNTVSWIQIIGGPVVAAAGLVLAAKFWVAKTRYYYPEES